MWYILYMKMWEKKPSSERMTYLFINIFFYTFLFIRLVNLDQMLIIRHFFFFYVTTNGFYRLGTSDGVLKAVYIYILYDTVEQQI